MDSEDVDVIFEDSVLHQVLQETGASNIETEPRNVPRQGSQQSHHWRSKISYVIKRIIALLPMSWKPASLQLFFASMIVSSSSLNSLHLTYQKRTLKRLLSSPLLCKDDSAFLDLYLREDEEKKSPVDSNTAVSRRLAISKGTIYVLGFVMISLGMLHAMLGCESSPLPSVLSMPGFSSLPFSVGIAFDLFMLAFVLFIMGLSFVWSFKNVEEKIWLKIVKDVQQADDQLQSFEKISQELVQSMIKCLRFVKDSELVAKGFLVARPTSNSGGSSFVSEPHHWCPRLRHLLFDGNMQMVKDVKETVSRLHDSISLTPDFEVLDDRYLQQQDPSFELLRLFDDDSVSSGGSPHNLLNEDVEFANNVIPSPKLSALLLLFRMHISYFFRGLSICFYKESLEGKRTDFYSSVAKSVILLRDSMSTLVAATKENHDFYRASARAGEENPNRHVFSHGPKGPTEDLYRCVNSLDIRLQSVADRAMKLRLDLERKAIEEEEEEASHSGTDGGVGIMNSSDKTYYEEALRCIKIDLDLCVGCYDESLRKLHVRERQEIHPSQSTAEASTMGAAAASTNNSSSPKVIPLKDPVIVDEVFEATMEEEEVEAQERPSRYRRFTQEEREQMRQHRDDLKRFSRELHAVVGQRAIIHRQREEVALARVQGRSTGKPSTEEEIPAEGSTEEVGHSHSSGEISDSGSGSTQREAQDSFPGRRQTTLDRETVESDPGSNQEIDSPTFASTPLVHKGSSESGEEEVVTAGEHLEESLVSSSAVGVLNGQPSLGSASIIVQTAAIEVTSSEVENAPHTPSFQSASVSSSPQSVSVSPELPTFENVKASVATGGGGEENVSESHPASSSMPVQASHAESDELPSHSEAGGNIGQDAVGKTIHGSQILSGNVVPPCLVETNENTGGAPGEENVLESQMSDEDDIPPRLTNEKISGPETLSGNVVPPCLVGTDENTGTAPDEENVLESQMSGEDDIPPRLTNKKISGPETLSENVVPPCLVETDENTGMAPDEENVLESQMSGEDDIPPRLTNEKISGPETLSENVVPPCLVETDENTGTAPDEENVLESQMSGEDDIPPRLTNEKISGPETLSENVVPPCLVETDENTGTAPDEENVLESQMSGEDDTPPRLNDVQLDLNSSAAQTTNVEVTKSSVTSNHADSIPTAITADSLPSATQAFENQDVAAKERESTLKSNASNLVGDQSKTLSLHGETDSDAGCRPGVEEVAEPEMSNQSMSQVSSRPLVSQAIEGHRVYSGVEATPRSHTSNSVVVLHPRNLSDTFSQNTGADGTAGGGGVGERNTLEFQPLNSDVPANSNGQSNSLSQHEVNSENVNRFENGGHLLTVSQIPRPEVAPLTNTQISNFASPVTNQTVQNQEGVMTGRDISPQPGNRVAAESYSLLAVKLTSAENLATTTTEEMRELLPGALKKAEALNAQKTCSCHLHYDGSPPGGDLGSRRHVPTPQQPYMEGWRSSVQRSKDMHWKTCERLLHENLGLDPERIRELIENEPSSEMLSKINLQEQMGFLHHDHQQNAAQNNSSFLELSMSDDLLFTPDDIPMSTGGQQPPYDVNQVSSAMPRSQVHYPQAISPSREGFVDIDGTLVSRHNFTPNCRDRVLTKALKRLDNSDHFRREDDDRQDLFKNDDDEQQEQEPLYTPNPNRRRHKAERVKSSTKEWVNITHVEVKSQTGSQFSIIREKDVSNQDAQYCKNVPTPDPTSSFNASLALMAAARAHSFPCLHEEHFVGDGDGDAATEEMDSLLPLGVGGAVGGCPPSPLLLVGTGRQGTATTAMVDVGLASRPRACSTPRVAGVAVDIGTKNNEAGLLAHNKDG